MQSSKATLQTKKRKWTETGAPAQKSQATRKGKRAWRKNVDISEIEHGLEGLREEERVTGGKIQDKADKELFAVDIVGDEQVRKQIQKEKKPLRYMQVLQARSAVPAVRSRSTPTAASSSKRTALTSSEKARLLQKTRRLRKGAFNSYLDPTESGSAAIEPRVTGEYDVWEKAGSDDENLAKRITSKEAIEYVLPLVKKPKIKPPPSAQPSKDIDHAHVNIPHAGTSYNPSFEAHQDLLRSAHEVELKRAAEVDKFRETKEVMEGMKRLQGETDDAAEDATTHFKGMKVDVPHDDAASEDEKKIEVAEIPVRKVPARKTRSQRLKAVRLISEKRLLAEKAAKKQLGQSLLSIKALSKATDRSLSSRATLLEAQRAVAEEAKRKSLAGRKLGKHVVKPGEVDVQLTEELSESLRALQPEGNLFKDRFLSMQHRALIEPRERVLPKKRRVRYKDYEKHPYKRFT